MSGPNCMFQCANVHLPMRVNRANLVRPEEASAALGAHPADRRVACWNCNPVMTYPEPVF